MKSATVKRNRRKAISTGIERICSHYIEWCLDDKDLKLWDIDIEHIQNCLIENYVEGELCTITAGGKQVRGWWNIQYR
jgi:hypothetical protein